MTTTLKSKCCNASIEVLTADEGTSCYVCLGCNKPCDPAPTNWRERFDERFIIDDYNKITLIKYENIKSFISQTLQEEQKIMADAIEMSKIGWQEEARDKVIADILEKVEKLKVSLEMTPFNLGKYKNRRDRQVTHARKFNYNKGLDDVLALLRQHKGEDYKTK